MAQEREIKSHNSCISIGENMSEVWNLNQELFPIDCAGAIADLWLLLDGEGDEAHRQMIHTHVEHCCQCLEKYHSEKAFKELINKKCSDSQAPHALLEAIKAKILHTD